MRHQEHVDGEGFAIPFNYSVRGEYVTITDFDPQNVKLTSVPRLPRIATEDLEGDQSLIVELKPALVITREFLAFMVRHFAKHDPSNGRIMLDLHIHGEEIR